MEQWERESWRCFRIGDLTLYAEGWATHDGYTMCDGLTDLFDELAGRHKIDKLQEEERALEAAKRKFLNS